MIKMDVGQKKYARSFMLLTLGLVLQYPVAGRQ